ncbi:hypothetical protein ACFL6I_18210 [candidate division KSB1 bacterium]
MANLLPKKERKRFEWEYKFRLLTILLLFLMATIVLGIILLLPSYFVSKSKGESIGRQSELLKKTIIFREGDTSVTSLLSTKQKINQLVETQKQVLQTEIIQTIIQNTDENVAVDAFYYKKGTDSDGEMKVTGKADSRTALLSFSDRLKKESLFDRVDLPVSSLARDSNITFSITLNGDF